MSPANLALRFILEIAALCGFGVAVWGIFGGIWRLVLLAVVLGGLMAVWGVFAVPGDASRSGNAPVAVPGPVRLILELVTLFGGAAAWYYGGYRFTAAALGVLILAHYGLSGKRIIWLLRQ